MVVLTRPDATADGVVEIKRVLQRPLVTRAIGADEFAFELARAYNQAAPAVGDDAGRRPGARNRSRAPDAGHAGHRGPARQHDAGAGDPDDQRAAAAGAARARIGSALRAVRSAVGRALPHRRRTARRDRAAARAARGAGVAAQDHGEPRHRREAAAAGWPHRAQAGRQAGRRSRVDAAHRFRRACRAAPARQGLGAPRPHGARHERADPRRDRSPDPRTARHRARDRSDRFGQDHDAVRGAVAVAARRGEHDDRRGSDRVRARRCRADAGQSAHRARLRAHAARDPAPGPGRDHDRRDPRSRNRADRRAGVADRPPGARHAAHERRDQRGDAVGRHGRGIVSARVEPAGRPRATVSCAGCARRAEP